MSNLNDPRPGLIEAGRLIAGRGWTPATSGNLSARAPDGFWVTGSGLDKGALAVTDFVHVDRGGRATGLRKPSAEAWLHAQLYEHDPKIGCVLHVHTLSATVISGLPGPNFLHIVGYELAKAFEGVVTHTEPLLLPIVKNDQDLRALAASIAPRLGAVATPPGYLIRGHGLYAWGATVADAMRHLEALEFILACELARRRIA